MDICIISNGNLGFTYIGVNMFLPYFEWMLSETDLSGYDLIGLSVTDLSEVILPHSRARSEDREEEERRMFYVALTRARRLAFLSWTSGSRGEKGQPSRFLREMSRNAMPR